MFVEMNTEKPALHKAQSVNLIDKEISRMRKNFPYLLLKSS